MHRQTNPQEKDCIVSIRIVSFLKSELGSFRLRPFLPEQKQGRPALKWNLKDKGQTELGEKQGSHRILFGENET